MEAQQLRSNEAQELDKALHVLDDAIRKGSQDVKRMIASDYRHLKSVFTDVEPEVRTVVRDFRDEAKERAREVKDAAKEVFYRTSDTVNREVRDRPWVYIGSAAVVGGVLGYFLSRK